MNIHTLRKSKTSVIWFVCCWLWWWFCDDGGL